MRSPSEFLTARSCRNLARLAFILCFAGSSIYLVTPLRPFHLGLALAVLLMVANADWRRTLLESRSLPLILGVGVLLLVSWNWATDLRRYGMYAAILCIGVGHMALAEAMTRRQVRFVEYFLPLCAFWFITAAFPFFDAWTDSTQFRHALPITGGVWHNINDMATALVYVCLIWMLIKRRLPLALFAACWFYAMLLNRRADLVAAGILGLGYLVLYAGEKRSRLKFVAVWVAAGVIAFSLQDKAFYWGALPTLANQADEQCDSISNDAVPLSTVITGCRKPPPASAGVALPPTAAPPSHSPPVAAGPPHPPPLAAVPLHPAPEAAAPPAASAEGQGSFKLIPIPLDAGAMLMPPPPPGPIVSYPNLGTDLVAHGGDVSTAIRSKMVLDMWSQARAMPWWQWITGMGAGQLDLQWPLTAAHWASPHFFWLEMFFYLGLPWFAFLGWLFLRSDGLARLALIAGAVAGMAPSSLIYFQPFWFLLGVLLACLPPRVPNGRLNDPGAVAP
ncbi:MAG: hypothetical protein ACN6PR_01805 [Achromobacter sp.]